MDEKTASLIEQQDIVLDAMGQLRVLRRGTLSTQVYTERQTRKAGHGACGPYHVLQGYREGKHYSRRVSGEETAQVTQQIERRKQFEALCAQYVDLGDALAEQPDAQAVQEEALKKRPAPRSRRTGKLHGS